MMILEAVIAMIWAALAVGCNMNGEGFGSILLTNGGPAAASIKPTVSLGTVGTIAVLGVVCCPVLR
jgi:hypothetical protein